MTIGSWDPEAGAPLTDTSLDLALLDMLADYSRQDKLGTLGQAIPEAEQQRLAGIMTIDHGQWREVALAADSETLLHAIRFLAVAENLPGWEAGAASPVIPLAKILRERGDRLDKAQLLWLREVSQNRFLPYGPL